MPLIIPSNSISAGGFAVDNSCRFNDGSSDYLSRTPSSAGNTKKFTISFWLKRGTITGSDQNIFHAFPGSGSRSQILFNSSEQLLVDLEAGNINRLITTRLFRDTSAWYHIVIVYDSDNGTSGDRVIIYINGVRETSFGTETYPSSGSTSQINTTTQHEISSYDGSGSYFDGYLAEFVLLDGTVADATSFGEFDEDSGIWKPKGVSGLSFGTNGFYLPFENSGALGQDDSGNGNNFTVNNLTSIDQSTDTCTNNFATMNPLVSVNSSNFSEGNLKINLATNDDTAFSSIAVSNGKWYWEEKRSTQGSRGYTGVCSFDVPEMGGNAGRDASSDFAYTDQNGVMNVSAGATSNSNTKGSALSSGDIICYAFDIDNGQLWTSVNGNVDISGTANATGLTTGKDYFYFFEDSGSGTTTIEINFGNPSFTISSGNSDGNGYGNFEYAVPSGYYALNTKNLAEYG